LSEHAGDQIAKVIAATAPIIDKNLDRLASFLHKVVGGGLEMLGGAFSDWAGVYRYERASKLADRVDAIHRQRKLQGTVSIPPRLAIPLFQQATLEDDPTLSEMWAGLLANAMDPERHLEARRSYTTTLSALEPLDARVMLELQHTAQSHPTRNFRSGTPGQWHSIDTLTQVLHVDRGTLALSLENLARLGLILDYIPDDAHKGVIVPVTHMYATVDLTNTGRALLSACAA
jgi:hypothetical protein